MLKNILIVLSFIMLLPLLSWGAGSGFVRVSNYNKKEYSGGAQNWCMVQDSRGKIYIGNDAGLLTFDGERWRKNFLANYTAVRSIYYDKENGRIYAGGSEEFGYFDYDPADGKMNYHSLMPLLAAGRPSFSEIWKIFKTGDEVWFQADHLLFCYSNNNIKIIRLPGRASVSSQIGPSIYVGMENGNVYIVANQEIRNLGGVRTVKREEDFLHIALRKVGRIDNRHIVRRPFYL